MIRPDDIMLVKTDTAFPTLSGQAEGPDRRQ